MAKRPRNPNPTKNQVGQKVGRPALLDDPVTRQKLFNAIKIGAHIETAIAFASINKASFYAYCRKGRKHPDSAEGQFVNELEKAISEAELRDLQALDKHSLGGTITVQVKDEFGNERTEYHVVKSDWRAAAWRLGRKYPDRWGLKGTMRIEDDEGINMEREAKKSAFVDGTFQNQLLDLMEQIESGKDEPSTT
jgi:hypothetical protein